jgi:adenylylsulfate kinase
MSVLISIIKTLSWRVIATLTTFFIALIISGSLEIAGIIGGLDTILKLILYFLHERLWIMATEKKPICLWMTGLSGSGKSTLANEIKKEFPDFILLDGDSVRKGLCSDLGFSIDDRIENQRRLIAICNLLIENGSSVITAFISPIESERIKAKISIKNSHIIYINSDLLTCIDRDPKGLYKKVFAGEIKNFTGVDSPFNDPLTADLTIDTTDTIENCKKELIKYIKENQ